VKHNEIKRSENVHGSQGAESSECDRTRKIPDEREDTDENAPEGVGEMTEYVVISCNVTFASALRRRAVSPNGVHDLSTLPVLDKNMSNL
jgi:hypothetical protein